MKDIDELSAKIKLVEDQILAVEQKRRVPWESLSAADQDWYGTKLEMRLELVDKEKQLRDEKKLLLEKEKLLLEKEKLLMEEKAQLRETEQHRVKRQRRDEEDSKPPEIFRPFNPAEYKMELKTFAKNGENHLTLLDRDEIVEQINKIVMRRTPTKYEPIVISTSRGMGKTFLLKMIALQKVPAGLECKLIKDARDCGRIIGFDFTEDKQIVYTEECIQDFLTRLMVWYLCSMFKGCVVDGVHFELIPEFKQTVKFRGSQALFNSWKRRCFTLGTNLMIKEYMRLTDVAFGVKCSIPPVFLLDEIQVLVKETSVLSDLDGKKHTLFSLLLSKLASADDRPVCICTGTNNGKLLKISEKSKFVPKILSLTTLRSGYLQNWREMTDYGNSQRPLGSDEVQFDPESEVIQALVFATYKIPRLLFKAHEVWFHNRNLKPHKQQVRYMMEFEEEAADYYSEMKAIWTEFEPKDIAHIIFATGGRWEVPDPYEAVPGTTIPWSLLIDKSLIFPSENGCFFFPYSLVWSSEEYLPGERLRVKRMKDNVEATCRRLVPNVNLTHLFLDFSDICVADSHRLGMLFEELLTASLAVKYYLCRITENVPDITFNQIYYPSQAEQSTGQLDQRVIDFSEGIVSPTVEATIETSPLAHAVTRNNNNRNAHHDMILYSKEGPIAVQVKASFNNPSKTDITKQLKASNGSDVDVPVLIWMSLGDLTGTQVKRAFSHQVAFLDGSGVCSPTSLDILRSAKLVKSSDNKSS